MGLVVAVLVGGLAVGALCGGRPAGLARLPVRGARLVLFAVAAQLAGALLAGQAGWAYPLGLALSALFAGAFLARNRGLPGVPLVAAGLLLNALVVLANGAMPVSAAAAARAGVAAPPAADGRHEPAATGTRLRVLGDVVPVRWPGHGEVVSPGDVLVAAGLGLWVVRGMRRAARRPRG